MRAIDYAREFKSKGSTVEALCDVVNGMMSEVEALRKARNTMTHDGITSILDEISLKWQSFVREVVYTNDGIQIRPDGFEKSIKLKMPGVYSLWKR
jgi:hypothetical protein